MCINHLLLDSLEAQKEDTNQEVEEEVGCQEYEDHVIVAVDRTGAE